MPIRPDFENRVNDERVESKFNKMNQAHWDLSATQLRNSLRSEWTEAKQEGLVPQDYGCWDSVISRVRFERESK